VVLNIILRALEDSYMVLDFFYCVLDFFYMVLDLFHSVLDFFHNVLDVYTYITSPCSTKSSIVEPKISWICG
jgi:hypothetical protein